MIRNYGSRIAVLTTSLLVAAFLLVTFFIAVPEVQANQTATVTGSTVNIRSGPDTTFAIITRVKQGAKLQVIGESKGWYNVRTSSGQVGWIAGWLVAVQSNSAPSQANSKKVVIVDVSTANIRSGPGLNFGRVTYGYRGESFEIVGQQGAWYKIKLADGRQAWISNTVVRVETISTQPGTEGKAVVTGSTVNIRSGPGTNFTIVDKVVNGNNLTVLGKSGDWYNVRLANGKQGWIAGWLVKVQEVPKDSEPSVPVEPSQPSVPAEPSEPSVPSVPSVPSESKMVISGASWVNIRTGPSTNHNIIVTMPEGTNLTKIKVSNGWVNVRLDDGREGWIYAIYTKEVTAEQPPVSRGGEKPLAGKVIVIDPGHGKLQPGGWSDPGAVGQTGLHERVVVVDISLKLRDILTGLGAKVIMTHTGTTNLTLAGRANIANSNNADIYVSVHANANTNRNIKGTSTYYHAPSTMDPTQRSLRTKLAQSIQRELVGELNTRDIGILQGNFTVIRETKMPSVLVETAFISNSEEEALLATEAFRLKNAQGIARGILEYFK